MYYKTPVTVARVENLIVGLLRWYYGWLKKIRGAERAMNILPNPENQRRLAVELRRMYCNKLLLSFGKPLGRAKERCPTTRTQQLHDELDGLLTVVDRQLLERVVFLVSSATFRVFRMLFGPVGLQVWEIN